MSVEFPPSEDDADLERVVTVLDDAACRKILSTLDEPMSANEIATAADIPLSSTYKKLDMLSEASLVRETAEVRPGRNRTSRYVTDFSQIVIDLDEERSLRVSVDRSPAGPDGVWPELVEDFSP